MWDALLDSVVLGDQGRGRADQHVADAGLADVAATVIGGEPFDEGGGVLELAVEEDVLPGHEHVLDDDHRLLAGVLGVADVDVAVLHRAGVAGLAAVDVGESLGLDRYGADDRIVLGRPR